MESCLWRKNISQHPDTEAPERFETRKDRALSLIILSVDDACNGAVLQLREPTDVWKPLELQYESLSRASKDALFTQY